MFYTLQKRTRSVQTKYSYKEQMGNLGFEIPAHEICEIIGCTVYKCIPLIDFVLTPKWNLCGRVAQQKGPWTFNQICLTINWGNNLYFMTSKSQINLTDQERQREVWLEKEAWGINAKLQKNQSSHITVFLLFFEWRLPAVCRCSSIFYYAGLLKLIKLNKNITEMLAGFFSFFHGHEARGY